MSDPHITQDWKREVIGEIVGDAELSDEDLREILNGQAELLDRKPVSLDNVDPYELLVERYGLSEQEAYRRMMDVLHDDLIYWTPEEQDQPLDPANIVDFSHEVSTNYSRAEDGLSKKRSHYGAQHPNSGDMIVHAYWDEYVAQRQLEGEDE